MVPYIEETNLRYMMSMSRFNSRHFAEVEKGLEASRSVRPIIFKNFKKMRFFLIKVAIIKDS